MGEVSAAEPGSLRFRLLGPLGLQQAGEAVPLRTGHQRTLLALLLVHRNRVVSLDRIVDVLWADHPPSTAENAVQVYVSRLRKMLGPDDNTVAREPPGYVLRTDPGSVDADRFEALTRDGRAALRAGDPVRAEEALRAALALWHGEAFGELAHLPLIDAEAARLEELRLVAVEDLMEAGLASGRHAELVPELEKLAAVHPLRERFRGQLMLALYRAGRQSEALEVYAAARATLDLELGIEPGPALRDLHLQILNQAEALQPPSTVVTPPAAGPVAARGGGGTNLPLQLSSFVGREAETEQVRLLLERQRLVTLSGPGGCGKTRLAIHVAQTLLPEFADGVWLADLADVTSELGVADAVAAAVGIPEQPGQPLESSLADGLRDRSTLLVLDNCEHLRDACARLIERLLRHAAGLQLLCTSREPLAVAGETTYRVRPFGLPANPVFPRDANCEAVRMFAERAQAVAPEFTVTAENLELIVSLCRRLDGMPLAIELAAARIRAMSPAAIASRLDDRFRLLRSAGVTTSPRHQTLEAAVDWSWELLSDAERTVLVRLGVFAGSFTLDDAERVVSIGRIAAADVAALLSRLVDQSLVLTDRTPAPRYRMLETIRAYVRTRLHSSDEEDRLRDRHAAWYVELAQQAEPHLQGGDAERWLARLGPAREDLRAAGTWLMQRGDGERALCLAAALGRWFYLAGHYREGRSWLEEALAGAADGDEVARAHALHATGMLALLECDYAVAFERTAAALDLARRSGDQRSAALSLSTLGSIARERGEYDRCQALHAEARAIFAAIDDDWGVAHQLQMSGFAAWLEGRLDEAAAWSGESLAQFRDLGDKERSGWALTDLAAVALYRGQPVGDRLEEARRLFEEIGFREGRAWTANLLGLLAHREGRGEEARAALGEALRVHRELGDRWRCASVLEALAAVAVAAGDDHEAARRLGEADAIRDRIGAPVPAVERADHADTLRRLRASLPPQTLDALLRDGRGRLA